VWCVVGKGDDEEAEEAVAKSAARHERAQADAADSM
jgi:hypothetical protein